MEDSITACATTKIRKKKIYKKYMYENFFLFNRDGSAKVIRNVLTSVSVKIFAKICIGGHLAVGLRVQFLTPLRRTRAGPDLIPIIRRRAKGG